MNKTHLLFLFYSANIYFAQDDYVSIHILSLTSKAKENFSCYFSFNFVLNFRISDHEIPDVDSCFRLIIRSQTSFLKPAGEVFIGGLRQIETVVPQLPLFHQYKRALWGRSRYHSADKIQLWFRLTPTASCFTISTRRIFSNEFADWQKLGEENSMPWQYSYNFGRFQWTHCVHVEKDFTCSSVVPQLIAIEILKKKRWILYAKQYYW